MKARILFLFFFLPFLAYAQGDRPLRLGVIGLTHTHIHTVFSSEKRGDFEIVGIVEQNKEVVAKYAKWYGFSPDIVYRSMEELIAAQKPENNPEADDDATIILTYDKANAVIQPSWNWPIGRKDMEIYGLTGAVYADNKYDLRLRMAKGYDGFEETRQKLPEREKSYDDPFSLFKAVIRKEIALPPYDLSSLENNVLVVEILDAARESAQKGKAIMLKP